MRRSYTTRASFYFSFLGYCCCCYCNFLPYQNVSDDHRSNNSGCAHFICTTAIIIIIVAALNKISNYRNFLIIDHHHVMSPSHVPVTCVQYIYIYIYIPMCSKMLLKKRAVAIMICAQLRWGMEECIRTLSCLSDEPLDVPPVCCEFPVKKSITFSEMLLFGKICHQFNLTNDQLWKSSSSRDNALDLVPNSCTHSIFGTRGSIMKTICTSSSEFTLHTDAHTHTHTHTHNL